MNLHAWGNLIEAGVWIAIGVGVFVKTKRAGVVPGATLLLFGISDLIEIQTGDWRKPWPLLAMKTACFIVLLPNVIRALRTSRSRSRRSAEA